MRLTIIEHEVTVDPVLQVIDLPAEAVVQHEIVVRPLQTGSDSGRESIDLHDLVVGQKSDRKIRVCLSGIVSLNVQGCRFLSEKPRLRESEHQ